MEKTRTMIVSLLVLATLTACSQPASPPAEESAGEAVEQTPSPSAPAPESESPKVEEPSPTEEPAEPSVSLTPCTDPTRQAIESTVIGQVDAFSAGDFDAAYEFASPTFQAGMPKEVFGTLIRVSYPQLLEATNARSGPCDADEDNGVSTIVMRFDTPSEPGYTLRYILELVDNQWLISGAGREEVADTLAAA